MREVAINTDIQGEFFTAEDMHAELAKLKEAGFTHIHWCNDWNGDYLYAEAEMEQIRDWICEFGFGVKALHATKGSNQRDCTRITASYRKDYTSANEYSRRAGVDLIKNRVDLAEKIGVTELVLHMYLPFNSFIEEPQTKDIFYRQVFLSLDELLPYCMEKNVRICIENLYEAPAALQEEQFEKLFARYPKEFLGMCLDFGHAHMVWKDGGLTLLEKFGDRIFAVHMHDNDSKGDSHAIPYDGTICWEKVLPALKKSAYELPLLLELSDPGEGESFLKRSREMGEKITKLLEEMEEI